MRQRIVVVGGGVIGLSVAAHLSSEYSVTVIDSGRGGTTQHAGGMLLPGTREQLTGAYLNLNLEAIDRWPSWAAEQDVARLVQRGGSLCLADGEQDLQDQIKNMYKLEGRGRGEIVTGDQVADICPALSAESDQAGGGVWYEDATFVDPTALCGALRFQCAKRRVVFISAEVGALYIEGEKARGVTFRDGHVLYADEVIGASGASWRWLPEELRPDILGLQGEYLLLRSDIDLSCALGGSVGRIVPRAEGIIWAGTSVHKCDDGMPRLGGVQRILGRLERWLPQLAEAEVLGIGAGVRPGTPGGVPSVIRTDLDGLIVAAGHGRDGILQSSIVGSQVARLL